MSMENRAKAAIQELVSCWTKKYLYHITYLEKHGSELSFLVEFSLPTSKKPIPASTVQVYFTAKEVVGSIQLKYRFERDSLVHTPGKSIRDTQMEQWIETFLLKKTLTRENVFYLGTEYEVTRVKDARQDKILARKVVEQKPQFMYIAPELLSDQKRSIEIMENKKPSQDHHKILKENFYALDKARLGVVSIQEFTQLLKNMGLRLNPTELKDLIDRADSKNTGLIQYSEFEKVSDELAKGLIARLDSKNTIKDKEEEFQIQSIMMLINEEAHNIGQRMLQKFKKLDEDEHGFVTLPSVKKVLEQINVESISAKQEETGNPPGSAGKEAASSPVHQDKDLPAKHNRNLKKVEPPTRQPLLSAIEVSEFMKRLSQKYMYNEVKYESLHKQLIDYKLEALKRGLINSNFNNLEVYLREIFEPYDKDKFGRISLDDMLMALQKSDKIVLTRGQIYVLRSVVDRDEKDMVNYLQSSKTIAELLKRFYMTCDCRRQTLPV